MIRGLAGEEIDLIAATELQRSGKVEVGYAIIPFAERVVVVKSRLQPLSHNLGEPLFLTTVKGDADTGMYELGFDTKQECLTHHNALVDRYKLLELNRQAGIPKVLLNGVL